MIIEFWHKSFGTNFYCQIILLAISYYYEFHNEILTLVFIVIILSYDDNRILTIVYIVK